MVTIQSLTLPPRSLLISAASPAPLALLIRALQNG